MSKLGERPHIWKSGPDPVRHVQYIAWLRSKAQANFRNEGWDPDFDFDQWLSRWGNQWHKRGRNIDSLCMCRVDNSKPWSYHNTELLLRNTQLLKQPQKRAGYLKKKRAKVPDTL